MRIIFAVLFVCLFSGLSFSADFIRTWERSGSVVTLSCWQSDGYVYYRGNYRLLNLSDSFKRGESYLVISSFSCPDRWPRPVDKTVSYVISASEMEWFSRFPLDVAAGTVEPHMFFIGDYTPNGVLDALKVLESQD